MKSFAYNLRRLIVISLVVVFSSIQSAQPVYSYEEKPEHKILMSWLEKRDPEVFSRCKVVLSESDPEYSFTKENTHIKITFMLCGNISTFWIDDKTKEVDCYVSYCGKEIGKKFCGTEIAEHTCMQRSR